MKPRIPLDFKPRISRLLTSALCICLQLAGLLADWLVGWLAVWPIRFVPQLANNDRFVPQLTNNEIRATNSQ